MHSSSLHLQTHSFIFFIILHEVQFQITLSLSVIFSHTSKTRFPPLANFLQCKWLHNVIPFMKSRIGIEPNDRLITRKVLLIISSGIVKWFSNEELASPERWSSLFGKKGGWGYAKPYRITSSHFNEIDAKNVWFAASHVDISERQKREHWEDRFFQNLMSLFNRGRLGSNSKIIDET